jgi:succinate dehydrogenase/fumarate reductase flavoprotein subunit
VSSPKRHCDVVVVGSGGAGLVAACVAADRGARVTVLEATDLFGGTTAVSGGQLWIPNSGPMRRAGFADSFDDALLYLRRVSLGTTSEEQLVAFLTAAPRLADYLETRAELPLAPIDRVDYHPDWAGARRGRTLEPLPVATDDLGPLRSRLRRSTTRGPLTSTEARGGLNAETVQDRTRRDVRTQGSGLVAGLVAAARRRGIQLVHHHRAVALTRNSRGYAVTAETADHARVDIESAAVVLATGGFAGSDELRRDFLPPVPAVSTAAPGSRGDAIRLGTANGGHLAGMAEAWWTPATTVPAAGRLDLATPRNLVRELAWPGSVLVNNAGRRFVNEASSYNDLGKAFLKFDPATHRYPNAPAWLIFDATYKHRYPVAGVPAGAPAPDWFTTADTLDALAAKLGINPEGLSVTARAMAGFAAVGVDDAFGRGGNAHDRFNGDSDHQPNPCLGPLQVPPFHAIEVSLGINGTKGGLVTDPTGAVLSSDNEPIAGLFACGEAAVALMGPGYAGSGASLGPALTTALLIGEAIPLATTPPHAPSPRLPNPFQQVPIKGRT